MPSTSARCTSRIGSCKCNANCKDSATRSSISIPRATKTSVAGTDARSASSTALRPATISPFGLSTLELRPAELRGVVPVRGVVPARGFAFAFSAAFLRLAAA